MSARELAMTALTSFVHFFTQEVHSISIITVSLRTPKDC